MSTKERTSKLNPLKGMYVTIFFVFTSSEMLVWSWMLKMLTEYQKNNGEKCPVSTFPVCFLCFELFETVFSYMKN